MIGIGIFAFLVFLFVVYTLSKEDFIFLRRDITLEHVFNVVFLCLPIAFLGARIGYVLFHPSMRFLSPLIFFGVPYFPGLSLIGGIVGTWVFVSLYTAQKKLPQGRFLDIFGIAFLLSFSIGIFCEGLLLLFSQRLVGIERVGESMLGVAFCIFLILQYVRGMWPEGIASYLAIIFYCLVSFLSVGFMVLSRQPISLASLVVTLALFIVTFSLCIARLGSLRKLLKK